MNEENLIKMSDIPDLSEQPKVEAVARVPHRIVITIEDINISTNEMALDVQFEPKMEQNVPMTAALSVAQPVLELLQVLREKAIVKQTPAQ